MKPLAILALLGLTACAEPAEQLIGALFDHDTPATMGRPLSSVYDACPACSRHVDENGAIWELGA